MHVPVSTQGCHSERAVLASPHLAHPLDGQDAVRYPLRRYVALSGPDRAALLSACAWLALVGAGLRIAPVRWLLPPDDDAAPARSPVPAAVPQRALRRAAHCARWLDIAARHGFPHARCLHRSLALHRWLRAQDIPSELRIGVRIDHGALAAHAWVTLGGRILGDSPDAVRTFSPLARLVRDPSRLAAQNARCADLDAALKAL